MGFSELLRGFQNSDPVFITGYIILKRSMMEISRALRSICEDYGVYAYSPQSLNISEYGFYRLIFIAA